MKVKEMLILARQRLGKSVKTAYSDIELIYCLSTPLIDYPMSFFTKMTQNSIKMTINGSRG